MKRLFRLRNIVIGVIAFFGIAVAGWYGLVYVESRVTGHRPPYLQMAAPEAMTIRWGTEQAGADTVFYGLTADKLDKKQTESRPTVSHRIRLEGLQPDTRYYYRIQHQGQWLQPQAEWFVTSPAPTSQRAIRAWILGDPGKWREKVPARDAAVNWLQSNSRNSQAYVDVLLTTGDNAYPNATNADFLRDFFLPYQEVFKNIPLWAVLGNHDARRWTFYKLFDRPLAAESGGLASGSRQYFSFDYGQAHFILIDNHHYDLSTRSAMMDWIQRDIKQTKGKWVIVLFHHPPYTGGTYDSDNVRHSRGRMKSTRENLLPVLEQMGVDMVITGHSHVYERSHLIHCHYGLSDSFNEGKIVDAGKVVNQQRVYQKAMQFGKGYTGTVYMVLGSSGEGNKRAIEHPALPVTSAKAGSIVLDIDADTLSSRYINHEAEIEDRFMIRKLVDLPGPRQGCE